MVERLTATTWWYNTFYTLIQVQILSHFHLAVFFKKKGIDGFFYIDQMAKKQIPPVPAGSRDLYVQLLVLSSSGSREYVYFPEKIGRKF